MTKRTGPDAPATVDDLCRVCGLGRDLVRAAIRAGELPGTVVGTRYVVPREAFERFCAGEWQPKPRPIFAEPLRPVTPLIRRRKEA